MMHYYSTRHSIRGISLKQAILSGIAEDGGLFMPHELPQLPDSFIASLHQMDFREIAFEIALKLFGDDVPPHLLSDVVEDAFSFPVPLVPLRDDLYSLELFHGPTLAFKDFAARFMARLFPILLAGSDREVLVIVATSGDTGSAVAHGFFNIPGVRVVVLYPKDKVSPLQEQHLTTLGGNIMALEVEGTFDDCQRFAKHLLQDPDVRRQFVLVSANSINIARLLPQTFYYFAAYGMVQGYKKPVVFSVPSGNFGNLTAGVLAWRMGLPIHRFVAATNSNDIVPHYLRTGEWCPRPSQKTLANAMDVGNPSNFDRLRELFHNDYRAMSRMITGDSFSDPEICSLMREIYEKYAYVADPHTAIAYGGLQNYHLNSHDNHTEIFLATAHPAKLQDTVQEILNLKVELPAVLHDCLVKQKKAVSCSLEYNELKALLLEFSARDER